MATPPPLHPRQNPAADASAPDRSSAKPSPTPTPGPSSGKPGGPKQGNTWLIVGSVLAGLLLVAAVLLYFLTDLFDGGGYEYDDGNRHEQVLRDKEKNDPEEEPRVDVLREEPTDSARTTVSARNVGSFHGQGMSNTGTISLDIDCAPDGSVTGTYWNMLYALEFNVDGRQSDDGTLELNLTQTKDGTQTTMTLYTLNGSDYSGSWGKKGKPVNITLYNGSTPYQSAPNVMQRWYIKGPDNTSVLNQDVCISQDSDGQYYFWYPALGYAYRFRMDAGSRTSTLYNYCGRHVADITDYYDVGVGSTATLIDNDGQRFRLERYE